MEDNIFNFIEERIRICNSTNEADIKILVVVETLERLGYCKDLFRYESNKDHLKDFVDIAVLSKDNPQETLLYVEVKNGNKEILNEDIQQILKYLGSKNLEWGMLTNGRRWILLNLDIQVLGQGESININKIVFDESKVNSVNKKYYLKYFSKKAIFDTSVTNYFKQIAQFKAYKYPVNVGKSVVWNQYRSTLVSFFEYLIDKYGDNCKDINIKDISFYNYKEYWRNKVKKSAKVPSLKNCKKQFYYISSMFRTLVENNKLSINQLNNVKEEQLEELYKETVKISEKVEFDLNIDMINKAIDALEKSRSYNRNTIIFLLNIYCGIERSELISLKWKDIDLKKNKIKISDRVIDLPLVISEKLELLQETSPKKREYKYDNVFWRRYNGEITPICGGTVNGVYDIIKDKVNWDNCCPERITTSLIPILFENGYSIETIMHLTGKNLTQIAQYLSSEDIIKTMNTRKQRSKPPHPFADVLEKKQKVVSNQ
jgi:integrase